MNNVKEKKLYSTIDICKFVFACLILFLHIDFGTNAFIDSIRDYISKLGVPFFFITSGFFLGDKINHFTGVKKYTGRLLFLFLFWLIIYSPIFLFKGLNNEPSALHSIMAYLQSVFFLTPAYLWYLSALIIGTILLFLLRKLNFKSKAVIVAALYLLGTLGNSYEILIPVDLSGYYNLFLTTRNGVFFAPIFLLIGSLCFQYRENFKTWKKGVHIASFLFAFTLFVLEMTFLKQNTPTDQDRSLLFSLPVISFLLFTIVIRIKLNVPVILCQFLRKSSVMLYCSQFAFITFYTLILRHYPPFRANLRMSGWIVWILTICSAVLMTLLLVKINNKHLNKLL